jgi:two-component system phosphate regulon response regulator PhoB
MMAVAHKSSVNKTLRKGKRILVVEDERDLADMLAFKLARAGYAPMVARDGRAALDMLAQEKPDLVLLDLMLPELSGTDLASKIRTNPAISALPIIMLTAKSDEVDQVVGLTLGADDYITKPFSFKVLQARIEAVLRRSVEGSGSRAVLRLGPIELNTETHECRVDGRLVHLTLTEFRLLSSIIQGNGKVLSRQHLISRAIGPGITVTERTIDVHVTSIRKKLGEFGDIVRTVRGVGYRATREPEPSEL